LDTYRKSITVFMGVVALSDAEKRFIIDGASKNVRSDGRQQRELRDVEIACGVISQATGSARVRIGSTDVIVGVKAEIGAPDVETPGLGAIEFSVECSPLASPKFRGRGGDELSAELSTAIEKSFGVGLAAGQAAGESAVDLGSLCILPGKSCWVLYVDALVLDLDGSVVDAISVACRAALEDAKIPKVEIQGEGDDQDFELDEDHTTRLDVRRVPLSLSAGLLGSSILVDLTGSEEEASTVVVNVSTNAQGDICGVSKMRGDGISPALLMDMIGVAKNQLQERHEKVSMWLAERMVD
jgi:exosome complex component RRP42